jgi:hypothetical protein
MTVRRETPETAEFASTTVTTITMLTDRGFRLLVRIQVFLRRLLLLLGLFLLCRWFRLSCRPGLLRRLAFWVLSPTLPPFLRPCSVVESLPHSQKLLV